jgi:plastocyanin
MQNRVIRLMSSILVPVLCLLRIETAVSAELRGNVTIFVGDKQLSSTEASQAVVYFNPVDIRRHPSSSTSSRTTPALMHTIHKQFVPRVLPIQVGDSVYFPNSDPILHNVFSTTPGSSFDTGLQATGLGKSYTFSNQGLVKVYCNVHHAMFGFILVLDTAFYTRPDKAGNFVLKDLPEGSGELVVFHDRAALWRQTIAPDAEGLSIRIDLDRRKVPPHFNKFGRPYLRDSHGDY